MHVDRQYAWYTKHESERLALQFQTAVDDAAGWLETFPFRNRLVTDIGARAIKARPFQFALWYDIFDTNVVILAVLHQHMDPAGVTRIVAQAHRYAAASTPPLTPPATTE
jgi:plasmid stabilization system protein ParE